MAEAFVAACQSAGLDVIITCTQRDATPDQALLYAEGRTAPGHIVTDAPPGESAHNYGLAFDVVGLRNGKCVWDSSDPLWQQIGAIGVAVGLEWAGSPGFPFKEFPHFQHPIWRTIAGI